MGVEAGTVHAGQENGKEADAQCNACRQCHQQAPPDTGLTAVIDRRTLALTVKKNRYMLA